MDVEWPAVIMLFYILCGLGFTIQGVVALGNWWKKRKIPSGPVD